MQLVTKFGRLYERSGVVVVVVSLPLRIEDSRHQWFGNSKSSVSLVASLLKTSPSLVCRQVGGGRALCCPVRRETNAVPFLTDKQMHETLTLTQTCCMLQNNTFVFILRFFLGFALPAGGLFSRAGCGSGCCCCCRPSAGCCSACSCTSSVCLVSLGGLLLALLHRQDRRANSINL